MEKANRATEKLAEEGKLSAIDSNLEIATTPDGAQVREGEDHTDEEDDDEDDRALAEAPMDTGSNDRVVQLVGANSRVFPGCFQRFDVPNLACSKMLNLCLGAKRIKHPGRESTWRVRDYYG